MKSLRKRSLTILIAVLLVCAATTGVALAYFSDYEAAIGAAMLELSGQTEIDEGDSDVQKDIVIKNTGNTDVMIRMAIYGPDKMTVSDPLPEGWIDGGDGWYYYEYILEPGQDTGERVIAKMSELSDKEIAQLGEHFDITVVHESAIVTYGDGNKVNIPEKWAIESVKPAKSGQ